jgi:hypothetical protein
MPEEMAFSTANRVESILSTFISHAEDTIRR